MSAFLHEYLTDGLLVMLTAVLVMCSVCLLFVWWVMTQPMPDLNDELDDERAERRRY